MATGLTCVGDDAQAIYAFRGADPAHLRALASSYADLSVIRLSRNYRSRHGVLGLANVIRPQFDGLELSLTAERGEGHRPQLVRCHDEATQAREICARILADHEAGVRFQEQAVLVRAAHHSDLLEIELSARGIPYVKYGGLRFTEAAHVKDFLAAARVVANPADDLAWFRLLRLHEGVGPVLARRVIETLRIAEPQPFTALAGRRGRRCRTGRRQPSARRSGSSCWRPRLSSTAERATTILAALHDPLAARYADAAVRFADLERLADAAAASPSLHDALVQLALDPPAVGVGPGGQASPGRRLPDHLDHALGQGPGVAGGAPAAARRRRGAERHGADDARWAGGGAAPVLRGGDQGARPAVLVRAAAHASSPAGCRRPAQLRAAHAGSWTAPRCAHCEVTQASPPRPALRPAAPLAASVDRDLASLWGTG